MELTVKTELVVRSCRTPQQKRVARRYLELAEGQLNRRYIEVLYAPVYPDVIDRARRDWKRVERLFKEL